MWRLKILSMHLVSGNIVGQGGNIVGQGGNFVGQGGNFVGQGGNFVGQGGNFVGQGGNFVGQGGNFVLKGYDCPNPLEIKKTSLFYPFQSERWSKPDHCTSNRKKRRLKPCGLIVCHRVSVRVLNQGSDCLFVKLPVARF
jgi:hypothetical protein